MSQQQDAFNDKFRKPQPDSLKKAIADARARVGSPQGYGVDIQDPGAHEHIPSPTSPDPEVRRRQFVKDILAKNTGMTDTQKRRFKEAQ
jgi:hypothetical protein